MPQPGEQAAPFCVNDQVTPLLLPSFVTVAVNCCMAFTATLTEVGDTDTEMGKSVMEALVLASVFVTDVAINDNWPLADGNGEVAGAV